MTLPTMARHGDITMDRHGDIAMDRHGDILQKRVKVKIKHGKRY